MGSSTRPSCGIYSKLLKPSPARLGGGSRSTRRPKRRFPINVAPFVPTPDWCKPPTREETLQIRTTATQSFTAPHNIHQKPARGRSKYIHTASMNDPRCSQLTLRGLARRRGRPPCGRTPCLLAGCAPRTRSPWPWRTAWLRPRGKRSQPFFIDTTSTNTTQIDACMRNANNAQHAVNKQTGRRARVERTVGCWTRATLSSLPPFPSFLPSTFKRKGWKVKKRLRAVSYKLLPTYGRHQINDNERGRGTEKIGHLHAHLKQKPYVTPRGRLVS